MSERPLLSESIEELEVRTRACWYDKEKLSAIGRELGFRRSARASALRQQIEGRIAELRAGGAAFNPGTGHGQTTYDQLLSKLKLVTGELTKAKAEIETQRSMIARLKGELDRNPRSPNADLFAKIHVLESFPAFAMEPLRREYRKFHHPDRQQSAEAKAKAHEDFIAFEQVFEQIQKLRGRA